VLDREHGISSKFPWPTAHKVLRCARESISLTAALASKAPPPASATEMALRRVNWLSVGDLVSVMAWVPVSAVVVWHHIGMARPDAVGPPGHAAVAGPRALRNEPRPRR
jgi:hypothetical protein